MGEVLAIFQPSAILRKHLELVVATLKPCSTFAANAVSRGSLAKPRATGAVPGTAAESAAMLLATELLALAGNAAVAGTQRNVACYAGIVSRCAS